MNKKDYEYLIDLLEEAYEYVSEMNKYAEQPEKDLLECVQQILADVEKRIEEIKE